jgi:hypothetical protein
MGSSSVVVVTCANAHILSWRTLHCRITYTKFRVQSVADSIVLNLRKTYLCELYSALDQCFGEGYLPRSETKLSSEEILRCFDEIVV